MNKRFAFALVKLLSLLGIFILLVYTCATAGCAHQKETVKVVPPCPTCQECQVCDKVEVGQCYHMLGFSVFFPIYDDAGEVKEVIPVPSIEPGCYCRVMVNDFPMLTSFPVPDSLCEPKGDEDGPELDGQGSSEEAPPEGAGSVGRIPQVESPHSN